MNIEEAAAVLAKAAGYDNRNVGKANVLAWHEALADIDVRDALHAVAVHHRTSTEYLMPVHIRRLAADIRHARQQAELEHQQRAELQSYAATAGPLTDRSDDIRNLVAQVRSVLPDGYAEALHPRRVYWAREHRAHLRQAHAEPNPLYRGPAPEGGWPVPDGAEQ